jgi:hypothetical protein
MAKLEVAFLVGGEAKIFLDELTKQLDRMEKLANFAAKKLAENTAPVDDEEETETEDDDEEVMPKAKRGRPAKKAASPMDDEDEETDDDEEADDESEDEEMETASDDEDEEEELPKAKKKTTNVKRITIDDVNEAAKAYVRANGGGKTGRDKVLKVIRKHFGTASLAEIKKDDYPKAMKLLNT